MASKKTIPSKRAPSGGPSATSRFDFDWKDEDFEDLKRGFVPSNTTMDTNKCLKLFSQWAEERNKIFPSDQQVPVDTLLTDDNGLLFQWLCRFSTEIRKQDGSPYPPRTINHYLMGLQRYIRAEKKSNLNLLTDSSFLPLKKLLDTLYRKLHSAGVGCSVQRTQAVTEDDEDILWRSGVLDTDTPQGLLNCVFFLNGKNFCLRGGIEHCNLSPSQLKREYVEVGRKKLVRYTYTEYVEESLGRHKAATRKQQGGPPV
jgi:hypothetical protein